MLNDIGEAAVERNKRAPFRDCGFEQALVRNASQLLIASEHHVVTGVSQNRSYRIWNVLVELDRSHAYAAGKGTIVSRARSAA